MYSINSSSVVQSYSSSPRIDRQFVFCKSRFWSATVFKSKAEKNVSRNLGMCPVCFNKNIAMISIERDEIYELSLRSLYRIEETNFSKLIE
jgi:hypothetical protein